MAEGGFPDLKFGTLTNQARMLITGWPNFEYQLQQYCMSGRKHMTILLCGKTGVGKSHLTNALIGRVLAKEGDSLDPETDEVTAYHFSINNVDITVIDTPGLADGTSNEEEYLRKIKEQVTDFDVFIFCTEMNTTRFPRTDDINTIKKLTEAFGSLLWQHAVVVLTFANEVNPPPSKKDHVSKQEFFDERIRCLKKRIKDVIQKVGVTEDVLFTVPFVAAGDLAEPELPGITNWLTTFWIATFKRLNGSAKSTFLLASIERFNFLSCEQVVPKGNRRSLPPRELGENQLRRQMQRRSFHGFDREDREHAYDPNASSNEVENTSKDRPNSKEDREATVSETKSKIPPKTSPKTGKRQDAPAIAMDESSAKEVVMEIINGVGKESVKVVGNWIQPGAGQVFASVFTWIMKLLTSWLWDKSSKKNGSEKEEREEHQILQEDDSG